MTHAMPHGRYLGLGLTWSQLNICENHHQQRWVWEPSPKWIFWSSPTPEQYRMKGSALVQVQEKKTNKKKTKQKSQKKNCMPGRKVQNHPPICPFSLPAKHSCQKESWCCSAQSSSTHTAYKPQLGCLWTKHKESLLVAGGAPWLIPDNGTCTMSSAVGKSHHNCLRTVALRKVKKKKNSIFPCLYNI